MIKFSDAGVVSEFDEESVNTFISFADWPPLPSFIANSLWKAQIACDL